MCLALLLVTVPLAPAFAAQLTDIAGHALAQDIRRAVSAGLVQGYTDGRFRPDEPVTRAQFAAILTRALGVQGARMPAAFPDVRETDWYYTEVAQMTALGAMQGDTSGYFSPDRPISLYEAGLVLARLGGADTKNAAPLQGVPAWAALGARFVTQHRLYTAFAADSFDGTQSMTRAQAASALLRFTELADIPSVFFLPAESGDTRLYRNAHAFFQYALSGRGVASSVPDRTRGNAAAFYAAVQALVSPQVAALEGITLLAPEDAAPDALYAVEKISDDLLVFTFCADTANRVPASMTLSLDIPEKSELGAKTVLGTTLKTEISVLAEVRGAAPSLVAVRSLSGSAVRRVAIWSDDRHAASYTAVLALYNADGSAVSGTELSVSSPAERAQGQVRLDFTDAHHTMQERLSKRTDKDTLYIGLRVTAQSGDAAYVYYPTQLSFNAAQSIELRTNGQSVERAATVERAQGVHMTLTLLDAAPLLSRVPSSGAAKLALSWTVLDAAGRDVSALFSTADGEDSAGALPALADVKNGGVLDVKNGGVLYEGVLQVGADAPAGAYSLLVTLRLTDAAANEAAGQVGTGTEYARVMLSSAFTLR